jgi:hypothetical protein
MKTGLAQDTGRSAKSLAKAIAKRIAQEPAEILKDVKEQALGLESPGQQEKRPPVSSGEQNKKFEEQQKIGDRLKSTRQVEALNRELSDIRRQDLFKDLQRRISLGEEIPLGDYSELSMEQKQVLNAQMEAVKEQKTASTDQQGQFAEPAVKKGRQLFNFGKKTAMKREQTHVEKPVPPSG